MLGEPVAVDGGTQLASAAVEARRPTPERKLRRELESELEFIPMSVRALQRIVSEKVNESMLGVHRGRFVLFQRRFGSNQPRAA